MQDISAQLELAKRDVVADQLKDVKEELTSEAHNIQLTYLVLSFSVWGRARSSQAVRCKLAKIHPRP